MARRNELPGSFQVPFVPHLFIHASHNAFVVGRHSALLLILLFEPLWRRLFASRHPDLIWGRSEACPSLLPTLCPLQSFAAGKHKCPSATPFRSPSLFSRSEPSQLADVDASVVAASCSWRFHKCPQNLLLYRTPWRRLPIAPPQARLPFIPRLAARRAGSCGAAASSSPQNTLCAATKTFKSPYPTGGSFQPRLQDATLPPTSPF